MRNITRWSIISLLLGLCLTSVVAQDSINLKPYSDKAFGFTTVIPDGWNDIGNGTYERDASLDDVTVLLQQRLSATPDQILSSLLPRLGLTTTPESTDTYQSAALSWTLYKVAFKTSTVTIVVDFALAQELTSGKTDLVSLQAASDEYETLHKAVFLPVLDALTPADANSAFTTPRLLLWLYNTVKRLLFNPHCSLMKRLQNPASCPNA